MKQIPSLFSKPGIFIICMLDSPRDLWQEYGTVQFEGAFRNVSQ
jgi:hypothetical protein